MKLSKYLDQVFIYLDNDRPKPERIKAIQARLAESGIEISTRNLLQVLNKLLKEELISCKSHIKETDNIEYEIKSYFISFEGIELLDKHKSYSGYLTHLWWKRMLEVLGEFVRGVGMLIVGAGLALGVQHIDSKDIEPQSSPQQVQEVQSQTKVETIKKDSLK